MKAVFQQMLRPRPYTNKKTGEQKVAHNVELKVPGVGTGALYVTEDVYQKVAALGLKENQAVEIVFDANLFRGELNTRVTDIRAV